MSPNSALSMCEVKVVTVPCLVTAIGQDAWLPPCHIWKPLLELPQISGYNLGPQAH